MVAQIRRMVWPTSILHRRIVRSAPTLAKVAPSWLNATEKTVLIWPVRGLLVGSVGALRSHNRTVASAPEPAVASMGRLGLNATEIMALVCPVRGSPKGVGLARSLRFHNRTVWSKLTLASVCPSGLNATDVTHRYRR